MKNIFLTFSICFLMMNAYSQKYLNSPIRENTTWLEKEGPFFIEGLVIIDTNITLTIEPGSLVIFSDYNSRLEVRGKLISNGVTFKNYINRGDTHRDSIMFNDKYYSKEEYNKVKDAYDKVNYETWGMPGLNYTYYQPKINDSIGNYSGVAVEYLIYAKVGQNDNSGPSHVRVYAKLNILNSDKENFSSMLIYAIGVDLSLEKNPKRTYLIPYFGLEWGGLSQKQISSTMEFTPTVGIHLLSKKNIYINIQAGYIYPMSDFDSLKGWIAQAGLNFALW